MKTHPQISPNWWQDTFGPKYLEAYASRIPEKDTVETIDFLNHHAGVNRPKMTILDLACGYGRHSIELARRGFQNVCGLDQSAHFLKLARNRSKTLPVRPFFLRGDMRRLRFKNEFDAIINVFTSFGYFESSEDDHSVLEGVKRALKPGGLFVIDLNNPSATILSLISKRGAKVENGLLFCSYSETLPDGLKVKNKSWFNARRMRRMLVQDWVVEGHRCSYKCAINLYTLPHLETLLRQHGLVVEKVWGDFDGSPYGFDSRRLIVLARRPN